jgi:hypothetical protein
LITEQHSRVVYPSSKDQTTFRSTNFPLFREQKGENMKRSTYYLVLTLATLAVVPLFFAVQNIGTVLTQVRDQKQKQIDKFLYENEPVEVVNVEAGKDALDFGRTFKNDKDWLKGFSITFKNKSDRTIVYFKVAMDFPETKSSGNILRFPLTYGVRGKSTNQDARAKPVKPEEFFDLTLSDEKFESLKTILARRQELDSLTKLDVFIEFILFDDGTAWSGGNFLVPDPADPNKHYPVGYDKSKFIPVRRNE